MNFIKRILGVDIEVQDDAQFKTGWDQRAAEYAKGIKTPYWTGRIKMLPLPAMPGEGCPCGEGCRCLWDVKPVNVKRGDYDCYWILEDGDLKHCQHCQVRAENWAPIRIRGGFVQ